MSSNSSWTKDNNVWFQWVPSFPSIFVTNNSNVNFYYFGDGGNGGNDPGTSSTDSSQNVSHSSSPLCLPEIKQRQGSSLRNSGAHSSNGDNQVAIFNGSQQPNTKSDVTRNGSEAEESIFHRLQTWYAQSSQRSKFVLGFVLSVFLFILYVLIGILVSYFQNRSLGYF